MGAIVNQTFDASLKWQKPQTWMRVNIGYIASELQSDQLQRFETETLRNLVSDFYVLAGEFTLAEMELFIAARTAEQDPDATRPELLAQPLRTLRNLFDAWFDAFHAEVERRQARPKDLALSLMLGCGAEMLQAWTEYRDAVKAYLRQIEGG
jgi:hypothetical protein